MSYIINPYRFAAATPSGDFVEISTSATQTVDSSDGDYKWFEFDTTTASAFTVTDAGGASGSETIEVYCIGGGAGGGDGSGGYGMSGGGGGAGGYIRETSFNNGTTGLAQTYDVTIGGGGGGDSDGSDTQLKDTVSRSVTIESGDYIGVSSDADFGFGTGDYTVEFWLKADMSVTTSGWQEPLAIGASGLTAWIAVANKYAAIYFGSTPLIQTVNNTVKAGVWQHWAISRKTIGASAYTRLWIDGVEEGSTTAGMNFGSSAFIQFGANVYLALSTVYNMAGELSSMRSYKGTVKYWGAGTNGAGSITPEMPNLAKETSKLLIQPNTGQSDWTDSSDSGHTINSSGLSWPTNLSTSTPNMLAAGGGAGGSSGAGGDGGSGGGGEGDEAGGAGFPGQGKDGGTASWGAGGGGGGAGAVGADGADDMDGGDGGVGVTYSWMNSNSLGADSGGYYAGGGGGGGDSGEEGTGGTGGGGDGGAYAGTANSGGGGGGGNMAAEAGGSGKVIVRYKFQ